MKNIIIIFCFFLSSNLLSQKSIILNKNNSIRQYQLALHASKMRNNIKALYRDRLYDYEAIEMITQYDKTILLHIEKDISIDKYPSKKLIIIKLLNSRLDSFNISKIDSLIAPYLFDDKKNCNHEIKIIEHPFKSKESNNKNDGWDSLTLEAYDFSK